MSGSRYLIVAIGGKLSRTRTRLEELQLLLPSAMESEAEVSSQRAFQLAFSCFQAASLFCALGNVHNGF